QSSVAALAPRSACECSTWRPCHRASLLYDALRQIPPVAFASASFGGAFVLFFHCRATQRASLDRFLPVAGVPLDMYLGGTGGIRRAGRSGGHCRYTRTAPSLCGFGARCGAATATSPGFLHWIGMRRFPRITASPPCLRCLPAPHRPRPQSTE